MPNSIRQPARACDLGLRRWGSLSIYDPPYDGTVEAHFWKWYLTCEHLAIMSMIDPVQSA